jgi:hypothetical protein
MLFPCRKPLQKSERETLAECARPRAQQHPIIDRLRNAADPTELLEPPAPKEDAHSAKLISQSCCQFSYEPMVCARGH